ncbi:MFS transporter [Bacillus sp. H-16]|uniref:MFS transporter n=1 Tax=Alteribacter salitolerans TaxID=2912333 RepID=UPI001963E8D1|nr:MFS transporter [Alteribacter salitolerans]MBM7095418.1 MFS transporter [Alteribacter salitolerans]
MWKNKNVWILLIGEFVAGVGLWLGIIGNLEFMQTLVPSDFMKSLILASGLVAGIAIGPWAGRITDRLKKKTVMLAAGFVRSISVCFMFVAIHNESVLWMVVFLITIQLSAAFYFPALQAAIPLVVPEKDLMELNGVYMNVSTLSRIGGTAAAGALLVVISLTMLYLASLIAYMALFILTLFLTIKEENPRQKHNSTEEMETSFRDVFPVIKRMPIVYMTLTMAVIPLLFLGGFNLMVINISEIQNSAEIKGALYAAEGTAFMLGAFFVKWISQKQSHYHILFFCSFLVGASQLLLYFAHIPVITIFAFILFGFAVGCFFPAAATIFQTKVPKEFHGRFFSFRNMLDRVIFQAVLIMTGAMLDIIGLSHMAVIIGIVSIMTTVMFLIVFRRNKEEGNMEVSRAG